MCTLLGYSFSPNPICFYPAMQIPQYRTQSPPIWIAAQPQYNSAAATNQGGILLLLFVHNNEN